MSRARPVWHWHNGDGPVCGAGRDSVALRLSSGFLERVTCKRCLATNAYGSAYVSDLHARGLTATGAEHNTLCFQSGPAEACDCNDNTGDNDNAR